MSSLHLVPEDVRDLYEVHEWRNATAILQEVYPDEWADILDVLRRFRLLQSDILTPGGRKSPIASKLDGALYQRRWKEKKFLTQIVVDNNTYDSPTHQVDCVKGQVALEVEWSNKDPFYDRDLNNFRLLFDLRAIDVGVIITRSDDLQALFDSLGRAPRTARAPRTWAACCPELRAAAEVAAPSWCLASTSACTFPTGGRAVARCLLPDQRTKTRPPNHFVMRP